MKLPAAMQETPEERDEGVCWRRGCGSQGPVCPGDMEDALYTSVEVREVVDDRCLDSKGRVQTITWSSESTPGITQGISAVGQGGTQMA